MFIYISILKTFEKRQIYLISFFHVLAYLTYFKTVLHNYYNIIKTEKDKTVYLSIILAFQSTVNIYYSSINTSDLSNNIGDVIYISYLDTVKTSYQHIKTSKLYITIGATGDIVYLDTGKTPNQPIKTTKLYITNGDADIVDYPGAVENEHIRAIDDAVQTSNVNIKMGEPGITI